MNDTMTEIELQTRAFKRAHDLLADRVSDLNEEIEKLKRRRLPGIRSAVADAAEQRDKLSALIEAHPELFEKPKTVVIDGVRVGFSKAKGKIVIDDPARTILLIKRRHPELAETCIRVTESPNKKALANVPIATIKALGCKVEETGDEVVIRTVDSDVDKLVGALLAEAADWEQAA